MSVCCGCYVLSGRGRCDELITRPEESYRLWRVVVCDLETTKIIVNEETLAHWGLSRQKQTLHVTKLQCFMQWLKSHVLHCRAIC
jgi:hypothetical protein